MKKLYKVLIFTILLFCVYCVNVKSQSAATNITFDNGSPLDTSGIRDQVEALSYILINMGLAIGAIPTARKCFRGDPGAIKAIYAWLGGIVTANIAIYFSWCFVL